VNLLQIRTVDSFKNIEDAIAYYSDFKKQLNEKKLPKALGEQLMDFQTKLHERILRETRPRKIFWRSPNGKYRVVGIKWRHEIFATILIEIQGRKHRLSFGSMRAHGKLPKYVIEICERIKQELEKEGYV
jgi:hypothetical protein